MFATRASKAGGAEASSEAAGAGPVAFAHLDADIYTSTVQVLHALGARCRFRVGTVLSFDEIFGPPRIQEEELKALCEQELKAWPVV